MTRGEAADVVDRAQLECPEVAETRTDPAALYIIVAIKVPGCLQALTRDLLYITVNLLGFLRKYQRKVQP